MLHPSIPAATLILFRARAAGCAEHLFVERAATMVFAAGAVVFPGGRVDADDHELARQHPGYEPDEAAARVAAIRETVEEAGIAIGFLPALTQEQVDDLRGALAHGILFSQWLETRDVRLDLASLTLFARWCPNFKETRNFDTRFYIAEVAPETHEARVDATENVISFWAPACDVLARAEEGRARVIFPTLRNLERLALFSDFTEAVTHAQAYPVKLIRPEVVDREGVRFLSLPPDSGYPIIEAPLESVIRGSD